MTPRQSIANSPTFVVSRLACDKSHTRGDDCAYRVTWAINPHMRIGAVDFKVALREHHGLREALEHRGATVVELPFVHGAFDSVFSKDNALLMDGTSGRRALMMTPVHGERASEQIARARAYEPLGFEVQAPPRNHLEGGDVAMLPDGRALLGHGRRSSIRAVDTLATFLGAEVTPLELVDPYFFHLDVALAFLSDGTLLLYPDAFTSEALRTIESLDGVTGIVCIPRDEALGFGLNMVEVGGTVILGGPSPTVEGALARRGWTSVVVPLKQFHLSGGSAACLTAKVHGPAISAASRPSPHRSFATAIASS